MLARDDVRWLVLAVCATLGCAHPRAQQTGAQPQAPAPAPPPGSSPDAVAAPPPAAVADFTRDVRPILEKRCEPCHFNGGKMYERLPFDRAETIHTLGTKLFTRIKDPDEQAVIRRFLGS